MAVSNKSKLKPRYLDLLTDPKRAKKKLQFQLVSLFLLLSIPLGILIGKTYSQLNHENQFQFRIASEEVLAQINQRIFEILKPEEDRPFEDYRYYKVQSESQNALRLSPLSQFPFQTQIPGLIGYFQVETDGHLTSPIVPEAGSLDSKPDSETPSAQDLVLRKRQLEKIVSALSFSAFKEVQDQTARQMGLKDMANNKDEILQKEGGQFDNAYSLTNKLKKTADSLLPSQATKASQLLEQRAPRKSVVNVVENEGKIQGHEKSAQKGAGPAKLSNSSLGLGGLLGSSSGSSDSSVSFSNSPSSSPRARLEEGVRVGAQSKNALSQEPPQMIRDSQQMVELTEASASVSNRIRITRFEAEIDPFQVIVLPAGHLAFFRKIWREDKKLVQGFVVASSLFFRALADGSFYTSSISSDVNLSMWNGNQRIAQFDPIQYEGYKSRYSKSSTVAKSGKSLLFKNTLAPPLNPVEVQFSAPMLIRPSGAWLLDFLTASLVLVLLFGFLGAYRLAVSHIEIASQRNDFVSAISHELKTPLTSIRMYAEMLDSKMTVEPQKQQTYLKFILSESERLSRLITNVLLLTRTGSIKESNGRGKGGMSSASLVEALELKIIPIKDLMSLIQSKVANQVQSAGFELQLITEPDLENTFVAIQEDQLVQIFINLVDNAIKFSSQSSEKRIHLGYRFPVGSKKVVFFVRDFGPGIPKEKMKKIFQLFYRGEDELTRRTQGTGIGLALVKKFAEAVGGEVDLKNAEPGAEFQVILPRQSVSSRP